MKNFKIWAVAVVLVAVIVLVMACRASNETDGQLAEIDKFIETHTTKSETILEPTTAVLADQGHLALRTVVNDEELSLLAFMVYGETGICGNDYEADYLQACVCLNRIRQGWGDTVTDVIYQDGQFETWWYDYLKENNMFPDDTTWQAVFDALRDNTTPIGLIYADSRETIPDGCYLYYESWTGQRFYCEY